MLYFGFTRSYRTFSEETIKMEVFKGTCQHCLFRWEVMRMDASGCNMQILVLSLDASVLEDEWNYSFCHFRV